MTFILTSFYNFSILFLVINCFTTAAGFTTILNLETREVAEFQ